jgi:hypothetical protein
LVCILNLWKWIFLRNKTYDSFNVLWNLI